MVVLPAAGRRGASAPSGDTSPLRILQLYPKADYFTGAAIQLRDLPIGLAARGHAVTVATPPSEIWAERMRAAGIGYAPIPMQRAWDVRAAWRIAKVIRAGDIQVAHAHKGRARTLTLLAGLMGARPRLVLNRGVSFHVPRARRPRARARPPRGRPPDPDRLGRGRRRVVRRRGAHRLDSRGARLRASGRRDRSGRHARARDRRRDRPPGAPARSRRAGRSAAPRAREPHVGPDDGAGRSQARGRAFLAPRQARRDRGAVPAPRRDEGSMSIRADLNRLARLSSTVLVMTIRQSVMVVALAAVMFVRDWRLALIALVVFPFVGVSVRSIGRRLYRINKRSQQKIAELNVLLHEVFSGTKIVKAFGREAHEVERFDRVNRGLLSLALKDHRTDEITDPLMEILAAFGIMGALWYGGQQVISGAMKIGRAHV